MNRDKDTTVSPPSSSSSSTVVRPTTTIASPYLVTQLQQVRLISIHIERCMYFDTHYLNQCHRFLLLLFLVLNSLMRYGTRVLT